MLNKIITFFVLLFVMESPSYGVNSVQARENLQQANKIFMELMLGSEGIRTIQSTPDECCQMIDGCLTAGITDRLYGFPNQSPALQAMAATLDGIKRDHALLAIEFYEVGYKNMHVNSSRNTPARFDELCGLAFQNGSIFEYKNRLEDEIKRASQPLRYTHFGIGVAPAVGALAPSVAASALPTPPPRMNAGLLGGIAGGGGGLRKAGTPSPSGSDPMPLPGAAVAATPRPSMAGILGGAKKAVLPQYAAGDSPPSSLLPVVEVPDQNNVTPTSPAPSGNFGMFAGADAFLAKAAVNGIKKQESDADSDDDQEDWK